MIKFPSIDQYRQSNNCATCKHKQHPDGGHCYMFRFEPTEMCAQVWVPEKSIKGDTP